MIGVFLTGTTRRRHAVPVHCRRPRRGYPVSTGSASATNASAGVMGKMISPQNLSVGAAGVGAGGCEGGILVRVVSITRC